jgi:broad specificity phosphatase PhoE
MDEAPKPSCAGWGLIYRQNEHRIVYFVHGTTLDNEKELSSGWSDVDHSDKGIAQSVALKEQTKAISFDAIFCSDLKRAVHSAELTWKGVSQSSKTSG